MCHIAKYDASDRAIYFGPVDIHTGDQLCERWGGQVAEDDWCESCDDHDCERCSTEQDRPTSSAG